MLVRLAHSHGSIRRDYVRIFLIDKKSLIILMLAEKPEHHLILEILMNGH